MTNPVEKLTVPVMVLFALFLLKLVSPFNSDPDVYWQLKTGEYIVSHLALPYTDIFSYTAYGKEWVLQEWLAEVLFYLTTKAAGWQGLAVVIAALYTLTFYVLYKLGERILGSETKALVSTLLFFAPVIPFSAPRPQMFTFLFIASYLYILCECKYQGVTRHLKILPVIMLFWVNLHGGFAAGLAILALFVACEWALVIFRIETDQAKKANLIKLTTVTGITVLASLANPRFIEEWLYPFYAIGLESSKGWIVEWQSPNFHLVFFRFVLALVILFFTALVYSRKKPDITELVLPTFFMAAGFTAIRHVPLMCVVMAPFFAVFLRDLPRLEETRFARLFLLKRAKGATREIDRRFVPYINLALLCVATGAIAHVHRGPTENETVLTGFASFEVPLLPVKAADFVIANNITGRVFNDYGHGGYLIYRRFPDQKVFIDGRSDVYGDAFVKEYMDISAGRPGWKEKFERYAIDYAILDRVTPLRQLLLAEGHFKLVYDDEHHSVLVRDIPKFARFEDLNRKRAMKPTVDAGA